jgi:pescadillo protein
MNTFFEFYDTLLNFILFKLYNDIGVRYPFNVKDLGSEYIGSTSALLGANLRALTNALNPSKVGTIGMIVSESVRETNASDDLASKKTKLEKKKSKELVQSVAAALQTLKSDNNDDDDDDDDDDGMDENVDIAGPLQAALENAAEEEARALLIGGASNSMENVIDDEVLKRKRLFAGLTFFLSREVPRGYVELVALAFGAKVGWEGNDSPISMKDPSITHHIIDRPTIPSSYETSLPKSREYVQPQWILDCTNFMYLLPIVRYGVGKVLPPHLSPWVDDDEE